MEKMQRWTLKKRRANYEPLSPLSFLRRTSLIYPDQVAIVYGSMRRTYREVDRRCRQLSSFLDKHGVGHGDVVSVMLPNVPEMIEMHFAGPANGRVLHTISTRLDPKAVRFQLSHSRSRVLVFDREYSATVQSAVAELVDPPMLIEVIDRFAPYEQEPSAFLSYDHALLQGDDSCLMENPRDEWQAIALTYTSGTTGNPKGVVAHHRGAYLNSIANALAWEMPHHPVYLWVLAIFHCNGWCFPWTVTHMAGTHVCLRKVDVDAIFSLVESEKVTHLCAAPIVLSMLAEASVGSDRRFPVPVSVLTAGAPPPAPIIEAMEAVNACVTQVYGLTETYSSTAISVWKSHWDALNPDDRYLLKARQGVSFPACEELSVVDKNGNPVPWDGMTMGEVVVRGNTVMSGYLDNPEATDEAFVNDWFHTGDLATRDADGYVTVKDRTKDMINSGGEKVSSIEVEEALYEHPDLLEVAVVAAPDAKWGEVPWAFVSVKPGAQVSEEQLIQHCRDRLAKYKIPKRFIFGELERTVTGKVQKFRLRDIAAETVLAELAQEPVRSDPSSFSKGSDS
jgi:fatty-acyl-CoA synthase